MLGLFGLSLVWLVVGAILHISHPSLPLIVTWLPAAIAGLVLVMLSILGAATAATLIDAMSDNVYPIRHARR